MGVEMPRVQPGDREYVDLASWECSSCGRRNWYYLLECSGCGEPHGPLPAEPADATDGEE